MDTSVSIRNDIAEKMDAIASILQIGKESLINKILEQYIADYAFFPKQSSAQFLLSLAGMFDSGIDNTSEQVNTIVRDLILKKYESIA